MLGVALAYLANLPARASASLWNADRSSIEMVRGSGPSPGRELCVPGTAAAILTTMPTRGSCAAVIPRLSTCADARSSTCQLNGIKRRNTCAAAAIRRYSDVGTHASSLNPTVLAVLAGIAAAVSPPSFAAVAPVPRPSAPDKPRRERRARQQPTRSDNDIGAMPLGQRHGRELSKWSRP